MQMDAVRNFTYLEGLGSHRWCAVHGVFHKLKGNFTPELLATAPEPDTARSSQTKKHA